MLSPPPDSSYFKLLLPVDFFIKDVVDKYSLHLQQYNYPFETISQMFNESLQSFEMPEFGTTMVTQNMIDVNFAGYGWNQLPKTSEQSLISDKLLNLTFRHTEGFLTYFMALELFFTRYKLGYNPTKRLPFGTVLLETLNANGDSVCKIKLQKCQIVGLNGLGLSYANSQRDNSTFDLTIGYTEFETSLNVPDLIFNHNPS